MPVVLVQPTAQKRGVCHRPRHAESLWIIGFFFFVYLRQKSTFPSYSECDGLAIHPHDTSSSYWV
jgi:hypothetical protein